MTDVHPTYRTRAAPELLAAAARELNMPPGTEAAAILRAALARVAGLPELAARRNRSRGPEHAARTRAGIAARRRATAGQGDLMTG